MTVCLDCLHAAVHARSTGCVWHFCCYDFPPDRYAIIDVLAYAVYNICHIAGPNTSITAIRVG